jgi:RNA polymerase sigma-70 factor (ECF subfamily)
VIEQEGVLDSPPGASSPRPDDDSTLVRRAREGDLGAFDLLVLRHQDSVFGLVSRWVGETEAARELTQDAFLRAWRGLAVFRGEARFSTWLFRIAWNLCLDHRGSSGERRRRVETSIEAEEMAGRAVVSAEPGPDGRLEEKELSHAFARALDGLDPAHRTAFLLRHQEGLGPAEIGSVLGISAANAKVRVHRARESILASLRRLGHDV